MTTFKGWWNLVLHRNLLFQVSYCYFLVLIFSQTDLTPTVCRLLDTIHYSSPDKLHEVFSIVLKGNTFICKCWFILVELRKYRILDILPDSIQSHRLITRVHSKQKGLKVEFLVCDTWLP